MVQAAQASLAVFVQVVQMAASTRAMECAATGGRRDLEPRGERNMAQLPLAKTNSYAEEAEQRRGHRVNQEGTEQHLVPIIPSDSYSLRTRRCSAHSA